MKWIIAAICSGLVGIGAGSLMSAGGDDKERQCTYASTDRSGSVICFAGASRYRARNKCLDGSIHFGTWVMPDNWSTVSCSPGLQTDLYIQFF